MSAKRTEGECKVILSALTSVGYIRYFIVNVYLYMAHGYKSYVSIEEKRMGIREGSGIEDFFYNENSDRTRR